LIFTSKRNVYNMSDDSSEDYDSSYNDGNDSENSYLSDNDTSSGNKERKRNDDMDSNKIAEGSDDTDDDEDDDVKPEKIKKRPVKPKKLTLREALKSVDERSLFMRIDRFFKTECTNDKIQKMVKIISNDDVISLRLLNWFAMKHSATMQSLEIINEDGKKELFDVKISYRARLSTHSKKYFDPFRRGRKFDYQYDNTDKTKTVETTLCQLNFFRWLFMHDLLDYVEDRFDDLKNKMGTYNVVEKRKKENKKEKEREKAKKNNSKK